MDREWGFALLKELDRMCGRDLIDVREDDERRRRGYQRGVAAALNLYRPLRFHQRVLLAEERVHMLALLDFDLKWALPGIQHARVEHRMYDLGCELREATTVCMCCSSWGCQ